MKCRNWNKKLWKLKKRYSPKSAILRKLKEKSTLTEEEKQQIEILQNQFNEKKKEAEEKRIRIPRIEDYIIVENEDKIPISNDE